MSQKEETDNKCIAQIVLPSKDLSKDMEFFAKMGFKLNNIFPDDDPAVAVMEGHGLQICLDKYSSSAPGVIHILADDQGPFDVGESESSAPNGTILRLQPKTYKLRNPPSHHSYEVRQLRDIEPWVIGRAGMLYRDLVPNRLGGNIMASHIRIPNGGPVPDMVHHHTIGFQLIYCYRGWVRLVYEDQGDPFILRAGDCVNQPPEIRHRVLEASDNLEVIEIGVPAAHMTTIDHQMELPTGRYMPEREFQNQRFCHHIKSKAIWKPWRLEGFEYRDSGINDATKGTASVLVARAIAGGKRNQVSVHNSEIRFTFLTEGEMVLSAEGHEQKKLKKGDAYVVPPGLKHQINSASTDLELLEVTLPGKKEKSNMLTAKP